MNGLCKGDPRGLSVVPARNFLAVLALKRHLQLQLQLQVLQCQKAVVVVCRCCTAT